jgi:hypothetical protein
VARFQLDEIRGSVGDDWAEGFNLSRVPTDPYPTLISLATLFVRIGGGGLLAAPASKFGLSRIRSRSHTF